MSPRILRIVWYAAIAWLFLGSAAVANDMTEAIKRGDLKEIEQLLKADPDATHYLDEDKRTPLMVAADKGRKDVVELLLKNGADVNETATRWKQTPIMFAWSPDIAELLIANGADVKAADTRGITALHMVENPKVALLLIAKGADVNAVAAGGWTPLMYAAIGREHSAEIADVLIKNGANLEATNSKGETALRIAARQGAPGAPVAELLKAKNARPDIFSVLNDAAAMKKMLKADPGLIRLRDARARTPLHAAAEDGFKDAVVLLVQNGADLEVIDDRGYPPLGWAIRARHDDVAEYLLTQVD